MNEIQKTALEKSIQHWKDNEARQSEKRMMRVGCTYCACCALSAKQDPAPYGEWQCNNDCPIYEYTGQHNCEGTPYYRVVDCELPASAMTQWLSALLNGQQPLVSNDAEEEED